MPGGGLSTRRWGRPGRDRRSDVPPRRQALRHVGSRGSERLPRHRRQVRPEIEALCAGSLRRKLQGVLVQVELGPFPTTDVEGDLERSVVRGHEGPIQGLSARLGDGWSRGRQEPVRDGRGDRGRHSPRIPFPGRRLSPGRGEREIVDRRQRDPARPGPAGVRAFRPPDHQGDVEQCLVRSETVVEDAVFPERLAMVAGDHDDRVVPPSVSTEDGLEPRQPFVEEVVRSSVGVPQGPELPLGGVPSSPDPGGAILPGGPEPPAPARHPDVGLMDAHEPYIGVPGGGGGFWSPRQDRASWVRGRWDPTERELGALRNAYRRTYHLLDERLTRLEAVFRAHRRWDDAVVVVTSDHGQAFGEHGILYHGLRPDETLVHVPLMVRWPEGADAGRSRAGRISLAAVHDLAFAAARGESPPWERDAGRVPAPIPTAIADGLLTAPGPSIPEARRQ